MLICAKIFSKLNCKCGRTASNTSNNGQLASQTLKRKWQQFWSLPSCIVEVSLFFYFIYKNQIIYHSVQRHHFTDNAYLFDLLMQSTINFQFIFPLKMIFRFNIQSDIIVTLYAKSIQFPLKKIRGGRYLFQIYEPMNEIIW